MGTEMMPLMDSTPEEGLDRINGREIKHYPKDPSQ